MSAQDVSMSASRTAGAAASQPRPQLADVEAFLFHEASLLDRGRFREWNRLFDADGEYWLPAAHDQQNPFDQVSHIYEDALLREVRVERFYDSNAFSLQPMPRSSHLVANIRLGDYEQEGDFWTVTSRFVVTQVHRDSQTIFAGEYRHQLRWNGGAFRIKQKRVELVNCEGMLGDIVVYL